MIYIVVSIEGGEPEDWLRKLVESQPGKKISIVKITTGYMVIFFI